MTARRPLPDPLRDRPFRTRDSGLSVARLRGSDLAAPFYGTRVATSAPPTILELCQALALRLPDRAFYCGPTAAALHGIRLPVQSPDKPLHVGVRSGERRVEALDIRAHQVTLTDRLQVVEGVRVTSPERTWVDLAAMLDLGQLVAAGDSLIWWRHPLTTRDRLDGFVSGCPARHGVGRARIALTLLQSRSDSAPESELRIAILAAGLPEPAVNEPIRDSRGRALARTDLSWPEYRVALEYEGDHHRTEKGQWNEDIRRANELQRAGWIAIRASAPDYRDPRRVITLLRRVLTDAGWDGVPITHW